MLFFLSKEMMDGAVQSETDLGLGQSFTFKQDNDSQQTTKWLKGKHWNFPVKAQTSWLKGELRYF